MKKHLSIFQALRFAGLLAVIGIGLISIIGTGGGHSGSPAYYLDADGDGYGNADVFMKSTAPPEGYVADSTDCDDTNADIHPGATETADDGIDQDCDGFDAKTWFQDADGDGYGNPDITVTANSAPEGYVADNSDCDDENAGIFPGSTEIANDGIDQDCDGVDLKLWFQDADGDGYGNPDVFVTEEPQVAGYVTDNTDCDDTDAGIHPGAPETMDDGIDQDCDGFDAKSWFEDADGDGYGNPDIIVTANAAPEGYVADNSDCDDENADIFPGACPAPTVSLTVNNIPASMNGSTPYLSNTEQQVDFTLAVPTSGFLWNIKADCPCGCREDSLRVWTDPPAPAGDDLTSFFKSDGNNNFSWLVDDNHAFYQTTVLTLYATIEDKCGQQSDVASLPVQTVSMVPLLDPFDLQDPWLFVYKRDYYTITAEKQPSGSPGITSEAVADGASDFIEDLWTLGLGTPTPDPAFAAATCAGGSNGNDCLARMILENTREEAYRLFHCQPDGTRGTDGVNIRFWIEDETGAPDPGDFAPQKLTGKEDEKLFSMMGFGGGDLNNPGLGMAEHLDYRNILNEDNAKKDFGVLTTSLFNYVYLYLNSNPTLDLMATIYLGDIFPPAGGAPIGTYAEDAQVIDLSVPDENLSKNVLSRREQMLQLMDMVVDGLSVLAVHEIGHSVGLVPAGYPPQGFFGGETKAAFIEDPEVSSIAHIDTVGLNIMQAGPESGSISASTLDAITAALLDDEQPFFFNEMNLAYLQGRLVLLPPY